MTSIGSLNESQLHADLKEWLREPGDLVEFPIEGFVADLARDRQLIEVQTRGFSAMRRKLDHLLDSHPIQVVYPVAVRKWILKLDRDGELTSRRRSPKQGKTVDVCEELVSFPSLLDHPNFSLLVALIEEEEIRTPDAKTGWRRGGYVVKERRLVRVIDTVHIKSPQDLGSLIPDGLPEPFNTANLAEALGRTRHLAQEVAFCLRESGSIEVVGRNKTGILYRTARLTVGRQP